MPYIDQIQNPVYFRKEEIIARLLICLASECAFAFRDAKEANSEVAKREIFLLMEPIGKHLQDRHPSLRKGFYSSFRSHLPCRIDDQDRKMIMEFEDRVIHGVH